MTAANALGLTDAVPAQLVVYTDGRLRPIKLGNLTIQFRLTAASKLYWAGHPAVQVVQALHWLRDTLSEQRDVVINRLNDFLQVTPAGCSDMISGKDCPHYLLGCRCCCGKF